MASRAPHPHCDDLVLHAPGECRFCDHFPARQQERVDAGINFTGQHDPDKDPCMSEVNRPLEKINRWPGNIPQPKGQNIQTWMGEIPDTEWED